MLNHYKQQNLKAILQQFKESYFRLFENRRNRLIAVGLIIALALFHYLYCPITTILFVGIYFELISDTAFFIGLIILIVAFWNGNKQWSFPAFIAGYICWMFAIYALWLPVIIAVLYILYKYLQQHYAKKIKKLAETSPEELAGLKTTTISIHISRGDED